MTGRHLNDEELSSHVDGLSDTDRDEAAAELADEHLAVCTQCRQRLSALETARELMRAPLPAVASEVRAASIAGVLRRAEDVYPNSKGAAALIPLRARRRPQVLVGSAAAVLALAIAVGIPLALAGRATSSGSAASAPASPSSSAGFDRSGNPNQHQQRSPGAGGLSKNGNATPSDLGALESVTALRSKVTALLSTDAASPSAASPAAGGVTSTTGASTTGGAAATATTTTPSTATKTTNEGLSSQRSFNAEATVGTNGPFQRCFASATHAAGSKRGLQLIATGAFRGKPALVYVFLPASGGTPTGNAAHSMAIVTARDGCRVLATTLL
jgi:hypothetical protein